MADPSTTEANESPSPPPKARLKKQASKKKIIIDTLLSESPISSPDSCTKEIQNSIRKKTDLEKWSIFF